MILLDKQLRQFIDVKRWSDIADPAVKLHLKKIHSYLHKVLNARHLRITATVNRGNAPNMWFTKSELANIKEVKFLMGEERFNRAFPEAAAMMRGMYSFRT